MDFGAELQRRISEKINGEVYVLKLEEGSYAINFDFCAGINTTVRYDFIEPYPAMDDLVKDIIKQRKQKVEKLLFK